MIFDLHCHSTVSDGKLTPQQLLERAVERGVDVLALTDHDTTDGIPLVQKAIADNKLDIRLINGVEISTCWENKDIHIVGLHFDREHPAMIDYLTKQSEIREARAKEIARRLEKTGLVTDVYDGAKRIAGEGQIGRGHIARYLIEQGVVKDNATAFKKYLARTKVGYVPSPWPDMKSAIDVIQQSGGLAVLAHPMGYKLSGKWLRKLTVAFKAAGGDGLEAAGCQLAPPHRQHLASLAQEYELLASAGSDFHFPSSWIELGRNLYFAKGVTPIWQRWPEYAQPQEASAH
ncbi:PHP domain-containing protein [Psychrobium sp. 1_MG-2023]|uniref:RNase RNM n=1 Tax=Psychrobium sp. 1_MG-2023 TaxID=3062624 RepID=UPI000C339836|nr:PHP domain-containing protein [Psychrobium sp. 1_MG-2023]MDP2560237.1 PHP domain-containing protein [Psychrobium sp. 1_MG-2023]PKF57047.1 phosphatase [Alteromonadales bacterium alter-6D02]